MEVQALVHLEQATQGGDRFHAQVPLLSGKEPPAPTGQEAVRAPEQHLQPQFDYCPSLSLMVSCVRCAGNQIKFPMIPSNATLIIANQV
jgi:hypothetical protein